MKRYSFPDILPAAVEKIAAGAAVAGCVVLALRTVRLIAGGTYLAARVFNRKTGVTGIDSSQPINS